MNRKLDKAVEEMIEKLGIAIDPTSTEYILHCINEEILIERARELLVETRDALHRCRKGQE